MSFGVVRRAGEEASDYNLRYAGWCLRASLLLVPLAYLWFKFGPNALDTGVPYFIFCVNIGFLLLPATAVAGCLAFFAGAMIAPLVPQADYARYAPSETEPEPAATPESDPRARTLLASSAAAVPSDIPCAPAAPMGFTAPPVSRDTLAALEAGIVAQERKQSERFRTRAEPSGALTDLRHTLRRRGGFWIKYFLYIQFALVWVVAQGLPADILDRLPALKPLCAALLGWNRFLASYVGISSFPQVATFVLALGWLLVPLNFLYGILLPDRLLKVKPPLVFGHYHDIGSREGGNAGEVTGYLSRWALIIVIPLILYFFTRVHVFGGPAQPIEDDFYSHQSRLSFGIYAQLVSSGVGYMAAMWLILFGHTVGAFFLRLRE